MSSEEEPKLLAGHPPAVKAGGMRIARTHKTSGSEQKPEVMTKEEIEEFGSGSPPKTNKDVVVAGQVVKEKDAFPANAIKSYHESPLPSKEPKHCMPKHNINQPR